MYKKIKLFPVLTLLLVSLLSSCTAFERTGSQEFEIVSKDTYTYGVYDDYYEDIVNEYVFYVTVGWHDLALDKYVERVFAVDKSVYEYIKVGDKQTKLMIENVKPF